MAVSVEQFVQQLVASGLISQADFAAWRAGISAAERPANAEQLARLLVKQKKLTKFQAEQIWAGKGRGLTLGNYVVLDKLGQGGMGMVLKARHLRMDRFVALKVMSPTAMKSPEAVKRFHREAQAAAKLTHPNIVAAYDADEANGTHFLVMQFIEGSDLSAAVKKNGPLPIEQAIRYIVQAARGLGYAHEQGVIHRDIKPANLLIDQKGVVRILDMGLARIEGEAGMQSELTHTGAVMGTVDYMAPEQALSTKSADARSDIYSLGISLWYLLTGEAAYEGDSLMAKLLAHRESPIPSLTRVRNDVPPAVDAVFQKMVAKQPAQRYQTMSDVIRDLESCLTGSAPSVSLKLTSSDSESQFDPFKIRLDDDPTQPAVATRSRTASKSQPDTDGTLIAADATRTEKLRSRRKSAAQPDRRLMIGAASGGVVVLLLLVWFFTSPAKDKSPKVAATSKANIGKKNSVESDGDSNDSASQPASESEPGRANEVSLLELVDLGRDASLGNWTRRPDGIGCENPNGATVLQFPYEPPEDYDFEIEFTAREKGMNVNQYLASAGTMFAWKLNAHGVQPPLYGFEMLDGLHCKLNREAAMQFSEGINVGQRYRSTVEVRRGASRDGKTSSNVAFKLPANHGSLRAFLDGRVLVDWKGNFKRLSIEESTPMPFPNRLGIGSWKRAVTFHKAIVREISGPGKFDRSNEGWVNLFNGSDYLSGWTPQGANGWSAKGGVLAGKTKGSGWLMSDREFSDYELELEYKLSRGTNSGIFLRAWPAGGASGLEFPEIQLLDNNYPKFRSIPAYQRHGSLYGTVAPQPAPQVTLDQWHRVGIKLRGQQVEVTMDDALVLRHTLQGIRSSGHIGLQHSTELIEFRNIRIRELRQSGK